MLFSKRIMIFDSKNFQRLMVKNIIFDFGGVLLDIDMPRSFDAIGKLLGKSLDMHHLPEEESQLVHNLETGKISDESFIWHIQQKMKNPAEGIEIIKAWNAMLIGWNPERFPFLLSLKKKYRTFLLSNTNSIHLTWVYQDLKNNHQITNFDDHYFEKTYYSHLIGMRKPNAEIYDFVIQDAGLNPSETIFIDDHPENIRVAESLGIHVFLHNPKNEIMEIFSKNGW